MQQVLALVFAASFVFAGIVRRVPTRETDPTELILARTAAHVIAPSVLLNRVAALGAVLGVREQPLQRLHLAIRFGVVFVVNVLEPLEFAARRGPVSLTHALEAPHTAALAEYHPCALLNAVPSNVRQDLRSLPGESTAKLQPAAGHHLMFGLRSTKDLVTKRTYLL